MILLHVLSIFLFVIPFGYSVFFQIKETEEYFCYTHEYLTKVKLFPSLRMHDLLEMLQHAFSLLDGLFQLLLFLVVLRINVDLAIFQPYLDLEAGDNESLKIQVARPGIEPRSSCSASQELNHSATAAPAFSSIHITTCSITICAMFWFFFFNENISL